MKRRSRTGAALFWSLWSGLAGCTSADPPARVEHCTALAAEPRWSVEQIVTPPGACQVTPAPLRDLSGHDKIAVSVYHFNVQYVAGGLRGFPDGTIQPDLDLDEVQLEDRIIRVGLEPVLDLFLAHPNIHTDVELQAYTLEVVARRHPDVLEKIRTLAARGQIDFDSFHYSDQLYVAYPARDLEVSLDLTERVFARACVPKGRSIFTQEGQFARGQIPIARRRGVPVSVLPKNLFTVPLGDALAGESVLYEEPDQPGHVVMLGGRSWRARDGSFELRWLFMDDGEIAFSKGRLNPYFGLGYVVDPRALEAHAEELARMEAEGFVFATIAEAAAAMTRRGIVPRPLPPVLDGTWQPADTQNVFRWMGGSGLFRPSESDSDTLAAVWRARTAVERAERVSKGGDPAIDAALVDAWREVSLAQVSDSTGWNPYFAEVAYSRSHAARAESTAHAILGCLDQPASVGASFERPLRCASGTWTPADLAALGVEIRSPRRAFGVEARTCAPESEGSPRITEIVVSSEKVADKEPVTDATAEDAQQRELELRFSRAEGGIYVPHALESFVREIRLDDYVFDSFAIPLAHGVIGLGGRRWVVQDMNTGRVAAFLTRAGEDRSVIRFVDQTVPRAEASRRRWILVEGMDAGAVMVLADSINRF